ncbi:MAG: LLM class flavin-dependent oxidoreductase [Acidimicrobiales bacterium]|nr:LLM class flavin-dependent oxidoreductase [Acidimicrobiales bacterium]
MEYVINLMDVDANPSEWARQREDEGWHVLSVADHLYTGTRPFPHVWVAISSIATSTSHVKITTSFVNNLLRSPVEVAQAALLLQKVSNGRFELGLGAGWAKDEIVDSGMDYPLPRDRAGGFIEAIQIIRSLITDGTCDFHGDYYQVSVPKLGPVSDVPPLLVGSVGGPRTVREVTPHLDRVEIKASSASTRGGNLDLSVMAEIPEEHLLSMIERVREIRPDIEIGMFVLCNAGTDEFTKNLAANMGDRLFGRFFGSPEKVADGLGWLAEQGISRAQLSPFDDASFNRLAPHLL